MKKLFLPFGLIILVALPALGQVDDGSDSRLTLLPIVFSSPDTRYAFGALPQYVFYTAADTRPSNLRADLYYTQNKQFNFQVTPEVWMPGNRTVMRARIQYRDWPTTFYGVRPPALESGESFDERLVNVSLEYQRLITERAYVGAIYRFRWGSVEPQDPLSVLAAGGVTGLGKGYTSGLGIVTSIDTRNHVYLPDKGGLARFSAEAHHRLLGSDYNFQVFSTDLRGYQRLTDRVSLAGQFSATVMTGDPPFRKLPGIGEVLRGYSSTRHIARNRWAAQAEVRAIPVIWRLGLVAFAGVGDAHHRADEFDGDLLWAAGFGVRFVVYQSLRITIRQDFGFGRDSAGDYLDLNEAF